MTWKWRSFKTKYRHSSMLLKECTKSPGALRVARIIKRLVWVGVVLGATIGCLITITDRIRYLQSRPTATTISNIERHSVEFPAVTVCNLNMFSRKELQKRNLTSIIENSARLVRQESRDGCETDLQQSLSQSDSKISTIKFEELTVQASDDVKDLIVDCSFAGKQCGNLTELSEPVFTEMGICYTFNLGRRGRPRVKSRGIGQRQGLHMIIRINQSDYATPADAGVKIAIHDQSEPPLPADQGVGVPTGRSAFISIKEQNIQNSAGLHCRDNGKTARFNFLKREFPSYSESACLVDCVHSAIARECNCVSVRSFYRPDTSQYAQLPDCTLENTCCILDALTSPSDCPCSVACTSTRYEATVSYSYFPAEYFSQEVAHSLNTTPANLFINSLEVNVYFDTLNVETLTTEEAYSVVALLADIGGQVGLFLGWSVISVLQFGNWIIKTIRGHNLREAIKNKCCHSEDDLREITLRVKNKFCPCCHSATPEDENQLETSLV